jgi:hypothetical protein
MHRKKMICGILLLVISIILIVCDLTFWSSVGDKWDRKISSLIGIVFGFGLVLIVRGFIGGSKKT